MNWIEDLRLMADAVVKTAMDHENGKTTCRHCGALAAQRVEDHDVAHAPRCPVGIARRVLAEAEAATRSQQRLKVAN